MKRREFRVPIDNADLRSDFDEMVRAKMAGGNGGGGLNGYAAFFVTKYGVTQEKASELAVRLHRTMITSHGC